MNTAQETHNALLVRVAQNYEKDGYKVYIDPKGPNVPFDLGSYRPDLLVMKSDSEGYIIEIKGKSAYTSVDRFREIAETVAEHQGWRFLLVTGDDITLNEPEQKIEKRLLSWEQILARKEQGEKLLLLAEFEGAFLTFWGIIEALMRKQAELLLIPIERFPTPALIKHLYSQGELSIEQFDQTMGLLKVRNQLAHGFQTQDLDKATLDLQKLVSELLELWQQK